MSGTAVQYEQLTRINTQDFLTSFGLEKVGRGRAILEWLCKIPAQRFARQVIDFDRKVAIDGLAVASSHALQNFINGLGIVDQDQIPQSGPVLILSNHPGMSDTLALFASIPRTDLRIVGAERPFLKALPNIDQRMIYVPEEAGNRMGVVRQVVAHLRQGGAVLTFPAGKIEPDPACMPGAVESLQNWSESISIFTRLVPEARVVVAIVSGVIWPTTLHHPLTRLRRRQEDRERLAASLQVLVLTLRPQLRPSRVRVAFSQVISPGERTAPEGGEGLLQSIAGKACMLIERSSEQAVGNKPGKNRTESPVGVFPASASKTGKV